MGGIFGRLFPEFTITVSLTIAVSVVISLTPMLCSRFLRPHSAESHGRMYQLFERSFDAMLNAYKRGPHIVLRHQLITLMVFFATTMTATAIPLMIIPEGLFLQQDTGFAVGFVESVQDSSFAPMNKRILQLIDIVCQDIDVTGFGMSGGQYTFNSSNLYISLKTKDEG